MVAENECQGDRPTLRGGAVREGFIFLLLSEG